MEAVDCCAQLYAWAGYLASQLSFTYNGTNPEQSCRLCLHNGSSAALGAGGCAGKCGVSLVQLVCEYGRGVYSRLRKRPPAERASSPTSDLHFISVFPTVHQRGTGRDKPGSSQGSGGLAGPCAV